MGTPKTGFTRWLLAFGCGAICTMLIFFGISISRHDDRGVVSAYYFTESYLRWIHESEKARDQRFAAVFGCLWTKNDGNLLKLQKIDIIRLMGDPDNAAKGNDPLLYYYSRDGSDFSYYVECKFSSDELIEIRFGNKSWRTESPSKPTAP